MMATTVGNGKGQQQDLHQSSGLVVLYETIMVWPPDVSPEKERERGGVRVQVRERSHGRSTLTNNAVEVKRLATDGAKTIYGI